MTETAEEIEARMAETERQMWETFKRLDATLPKLEMIWVPDRTYALFEEYWKSGRRKAQS